MYFHFSPDHLGKYQYWDKTFEECEQRTIRTTKKQLLFIKQARKFTDLQHGITIGCQNSLSEEGLVFSIGGPNVEDTQSNQTILSSVIYYTGTDPLNGESFPVTRDMNERRKQHNVFFS